MLRAELICLALEVFKVNLSRPIILLSTEPILWFWDIYISVNSSSFSVCFLSLISSPLGVSRLYGEDYAI